MGERGFCGPDCGLIPFGTTLADFVWPESKRNQNEEGWILWLTGAYSFSHRNTRTIVSVIPKARLLAGKLSATTFRPFARLQNLPSVRQLISFACVLRFLSWDDFAIRIVSPSTHRLQRADNRFCVGLDLARALHKFNQNARSCSRIDLVPYRAILSWRYPGSVFTSRFSIPSVLVSSCQLH